MPRPYLLLFTLTIAGCAAQARQPAPSRPQEAAISRPVPMPPSPATTTSENLAPLPEFQPDPTASPADTLAAKRFFEALQALEEARKLDPKRPEALLNEAILLHEYGPVLGGNGAERSLLRAMQLYRLFIQMAEANPAYNEEINAAKVRLSWIEDMVFCRFRETEADRKKRIAEEKQREAQEELSPF